MSLLVASRLGLRGRLDETSLTLSEGSLTCLVGPNGSGKTSLLHAIAGIGSPSGEVSIDGVDPRGLGPDRRQRLLSFLPASRDLKWPLKVADIVALGGNKDAMTPILADLELATLADRRADLLSTGERSRVLIARALAARPRLLLLDEPVANLDPLWQLRLMDYLHKIVSEESRAALVAMHDLDLARRYGDRVIIMNKGKIAADGAARDLLEGPRVAEIFGVEMRDGAWQRAVET